MLSLCTCAFLFIKSVFSLLKMSEMGFENVFYLESEYNLCYSCVEMRRDEVLPGYAQWKLSTPLPADQ